ncbi:MAG: cytochrome C [Syntrophaceae bacterium]|nr:cytochrome C [Syntrophaceae bacterium]NTW66402.1 cytochrome C [Nitrospirota bacterium]
MKSRALLILLSVACSLAVMVVGSDAKDVFKLKPGAQGKVCLTCHASFSEKMKSAFVHTPLKQGECTGCHSPHTSSHGKMLAVDPNKICFSCHAAMVSGKAKSSHKVVAEGGCIKCHDPHAAANKFNLKLAGEKLCLECHKELGEAIGKAKRKHKPVTSGCLTCHDPHESTTALHLLKKDVPGLCKGCHQTDKPFFVKVHQNYPVANSQCTSCHNTHGSSKSSLLYDTVHAPVANRVCNQCHNEPTSPTPLKTKKTGFELCRGCHYQMVNATFSMNRIHWPIVDQRGCMNCHSPHASKGKGLLNQTSMTKLCGNCHKDTITRQEKAVSKHNPVEAGMCDSCHSPHASNTVLLLNQPVIELCSNCHDFSKHTSHPIGEKAVDPRNKNLSIDCLSCHRSHGSDQKRLAHFQFGMDLCVQCHEQLKR